MQKRIDVLGVGISAVDDLKYIAEYPPIDSKVAVTASTRQGGGPACTAIAAVGVLGGRALYAARFGENDLARYIRAALASRGVDLSAIVDDPAGGPYHSTIVVDAAGHRNVFYDPSLYRIVQASDLPNATIESARIFLLDHITEPSLLPVAEKVRRLGVPILADIEGRTESAMPLAQLADYLVVPRSFATWATGESNANAACATLARTQRLATVVTDGSAGCHACIGAEPTARHFPAFPVQAFDTTGCGDTFHGAFALAVARGIEVEDVIVFASAAAALKAMAAGGQRRGWEALPTRNEVMDFLRSELSEPQKSLLLNKLQAVLCA